MLWYFLFSSLSNTLGACNVITERDVVLYKLLMVVHASRRSSCDSRKSIQVELATEGFKLALIKIDWHDAFHKQIDIVDLEGGSSMDPRDNVFKAFSLGIL